MALRLVPVEFKDANRFVELHHRTHDPVRGWKFGAGVANDDDVLVGVYIVGRPPRGFQDGMTLCVTRCATDETKNAASMLYGAAWRATSAQGYRRLVTYTEAGESGASLRAAGYRVVAERPARKGYSCMSRPRDDSRYRSIDRTLWEAC